MFLLLLERSQRCLNQWKSHSMVQWWPFCKLFRKIVKGVSFNGNLIQCNGGHFKTILREVSFNGNLSHRCKMRIFSTISNSRSWQRWRLTWSTLAESNVENITLNIVKPWYISNDPISVKCTHSFMSQVSPKTKETEDRIGLVCTRIVNVFDNSIQSSIYWPWIPQ